MIAQAGSNPEVPDDPIALADALGQAYVDAQTAEYRKRLGLYLTPMPVARYMAAMTTFEGECCHALDPAAGAGVLLAALVQHLVLRERPPKKIRLTAFELDNNLKPVLQEVLARLIAWSEARGVIVEAEILSEDFVLKCSGILGQTFGALPFLAGEKQFDIVIANPPYFKLPKNDPRSIAAATVVHGQPNIYGFFLAIGATLLRKGGELVTITPRSFASGPYFQRFRALFFQIMQPRWVHIFVSRKEAFSRDAVLQETVIMKSLRRDDWARSIAGSESLAVSTSQGSSDITEGLLQWVNILDAYNPGSRDQVFRLISSSDDDDIVRLVQGWTGSLRAFGMHISTGPVVPFRATELIKAKGAVPTTHAPLIWMNHVSAMRVVWPISSRKEEYIHRRAQDRRLLVANRNYVLIRRFSSKEQLRRLIAAPYEARSIPGDLIGLENHLNYIYRPNGSLSIEEVRGLAAILSSKMLDDYFRTSNGNTQVSATELRAMPLPELALIRAIGRRVKKSMSLEDVDSLVADVLLWEGSKKSGQLS